MSVGRNGPGSMSSGNVGQGGSQGKDPLAPALPGSRNAGMYQHPAVAGYNTQDSRSQAMPSVRYGFSKIIVWKLHWSEISAW